MKSRIAKSVLRTGTAVGACFLLTLNTAAWSQDYPAKPIRIIVPAPPGSGPGTDLRSSAARLGPYFSQPIIIENRPGAGTRIAIEAVAKSAPDGYTFLVGTPSLATADALYAKLPFDARRDLVPVSLLSTTAYALVVNAQVPAQTLQAFIALSKTSSAHNNMGTGSDSIGSTPEEFGAFLDAEREKWGSVIRKIGLKLE